MLESTCRLIYDETDSYCIMGVCGSIDLLAVFPMLLPAAVLPKLSMDQPSLIINIGVLTDTYLPISGPLEAFAMPSLQESTPAMARKERKIEVLGLRDGEIS
ncbi:hypothetical protein GGR56DRAFT_643089 [Xylariaceae sp. FL0804]|nr:hypothetical protein GGR56DRAFT_643089 [Xylariaceae sp. FL0804]